MATTYKTKALQSIEDRLVGLEEGSIRHATLKAARDFKMSWIRLGQMLHQVYRQKSFKEWGYMTFEGYVTKEIGVRQQTASKLMKSYLFLEREEPLYVRAETISDEANSLEGSDKKELPSAKIPSYEAVDALRRAKGKISDEEYHDLRKEAFENGREGKEIRQKAALIMREKEPPDPEKVRATRRQLVLGRLLKMLKSFGDEAEHTKFLPKALIHQLTDLAEKIEEELERHRADRTVPLD